MTQITVQQIFRTTAFMAGMIHCLSCENSSVEQVWDAVHSLSTVILEMLVYKWTWILCLLEQLLLLIDRLDKFIVIDNDFVVKKKVVDNKKKPVCEPSNW